MLEYQSIIDRLSLADKASLLSGDDMWHTKAIPHMNIPAIMMTDGPHGLRKQDKINVGNIYASAKSTCYPPACLTACSWDEELLQSMGDALGKECQSEKVSVILGPGVNIKRSPLCGRNFEYFSEDPVLAGKLAAAMIRGIEYRGISTSLKHFACNNQEYMRMITDAIVDERTLRDIYLKPFEIAVREGKPSTVMCSYNKVNGIYASENRYLLTDILRKEWGFDGVVVSDWGAVDTRYMGVHAGLDLEMPSSGGINDEQIVNATTNGLLPEEYVDIAVNNLLKLIYKGDKINHISVTYDKDEHDALAAKIAEESMVLLKNDDNILPLNKANKVLVIGELADHPRYQGGGSSHITPTKVASLLDGLTDIGVDYDYRRGYHLTNGNPDKKLIKHALSNINSYNNVVLCIGLTEELESEGFDRKHMDLPTAHSILVEQILDICPNCIINIVGGSPIAMPWRNKAKAILYSYLGGQAGGLATARLLYGDRVPCGKLAESFPDKLSDTPCYNNYYLNERYSLYSEAIFVGYRYYSSANIEPAFAFGHGLSYANFKYDNLTINSNTYSKGEKVTLTFDVSNISDIDAKEITQVYITKPNGKIYNPRIELIGFTKVDIKAHSTQTTVINIDIDKLGYYDTTTRSTLVESGKYKISIGASSVDLLLYCDINVHGDSDTQVNYDNKIWYHNPTSNIIPREDFALIYGELPNTDITPPKKGEFTDDNCFGDMRNNSMLARFTIKVAGFVIRKFVLHTNKLDTGYLMMLELFISSPLKKLSFSSQGAFSASMTEGLLTILNGKFFKGLKQLIKGSKTAPKLKL